MTDKKGKKFLTKTYLKSLDKLRDPAVRVSIENKVNKLLENPSIAEPMQHQHEGFCEISIGSKYRVYCIRLDGVIIVFIMGLAIHHDENYKQAKEYQKLFEQLKKVKEEFKGEI